MKNLFLLGCLLLSSIISFGQDALVKISPFHFIDGTFYTTYERAMKNNSSFMLSGGYNLTQNGDEYGWMGEFQLRKYVYKPSINSSSESKLAGVYAGLYANGKYFVQQYSTYYYSWDVEPYTDYTYDQNGNIIGSTYHEGQGYHSEYIDEEYEIKQGEGGVLMGMQILFSGNFSMDFFIGGGLRSSTVENKPVDFEFYSPERGYTGIVPKIGFEVGISF